MSDDLRASLMKNMQTSSMLFSAYSGIVNGLFASLRSLGEADAETLAKACSRDVGYVRRWCDAAYAFRLLEAEGDRFTLSELGASFCPDAPQTLVPFALHAILGAHFAERGAELMQSGERPGEKVIAECKTLMPFFGVMLEAQFGPFFEEHILPAVDAYADVEARGGLAVDLGCGNGWYLRRLASRYAGLRAIGLDGFEQSIAAAREAAEREGLSDRVQFRAGDLHHFSIDEPVDLIAMNRALHHVWEQGPRVFEILSDHLRPGGYAVIWEPAWPDARDALRNPGMAGMALQNLAEHIQGNHFLRPQEIADALEAVGLHSEIHLFAEGKEAVVTGRKKD